MPARLPDPHEALLAVVANTGDKVGSVAGVWGSRKERCQLAMGENPGLAVLCSWRKDMSFRESIMKDLFPAIPNFLS